jgi:hypothetical protein
MQPRRLAVALFALFGAAAAAGAGTIRQVILDDGRSVDDRIGAPLVVTEDKAPLRIGPIVSAYDKKANVIRGYKIRLGRGPTYTLAPSVDLGALFTESLRAEAAGMGFRVLDATDTSTPSWDVSGELVDVYADTPPSFVFFSYGHLVANLRVQPPGGSPEAVRLGVHVSSAAYNPDFDGRKDEASEGLARLIVVGSQEMLARLNRRYFKAAPRPDIENKLRRVTSSGVAGNENDLHMIGLAGYTAGAGPLRALLTKEADARHRSRVIDVLALIGSDDDVAALSERYGREHEDCRFSIIKAMAYIGGDAAIALIREKGAIDKHEGTRRMATRLVPARSQ